MGHGETHVWEKWDATKVRPKAPRPKTMDQYFALSSGACPGPTNLLPSSTGTKGRFLRMMAQACRNVENAEADTRGNVRYSSSTGSMTIKCFPSIHFGMSTPRLTKLRYSRCPSSVNYVRGFDKYAPGWCNGSLQKYMKNKNGGKRANDTPVNGL